VPTVPRSANGVTRCHVRAILCQLHAAYMLFCSRRRKVAGAPWSGVVMGEGWGAISFGG
jgi:hypothetical protein